jgi:hypothetical protein
MFLYLGIVSWRYLHFFFTYLNLLKLLYIILQLTEIMSGQKHLMMCMTSHTKAKFAGMLGGGGLKIKVLQSDLQKLWN